MKFLGSSTKGVDWHCLYQKIAHQTSGLSPVLHHCPDQTHATTILAPSSVCWCVGHSPVVFSDCASFHPPLLSIAPLTNLYRWPDYSFDPWVIFNSYIFLHFEMAKGRKVTLRTNNSAFDNPSLQMNPSSEKKLVSCKCVFITKYKVNHSIERLLARLVAKGFIQTYRVDYQKTFVLLLQRWI